MGLLRLLLIALAIYVVYTLIRRLGAPKQPPGETQATKFEPMVRCAHCGVNVPRDQAVRSRDGHYYCSPEHRDANQ